MFQETRIRHFLCYSISSLTVAQLCSFPFNQIKNFNAEQFLFVSVFLLTTCSWNSYIYPSWLDYKTMTIMPKLYTADMAIIFHHNVIFMSNPTCLDQKYKLTVRRKLTVLRWWRFYISFFILLIDLFKIWRMQRIPGNFSELLGDSERD